VNGLGLGVDDALANVTAFRGRMRLLVDSEPVWDRLRALVATYRCMGKQIHDALIVATALTSGVTRLVTANAGDFNRFAADIEAIDLASADPARD
jgi:predicted nucleic acid-binding protein